MGQVTTETNLRRKRGGREKRWGEGVIGGSSHSVTPGADSVYGDVSHVVGLLLGTRATRVMRK